MNKLEKTLFEDLTKQAGFYIKDYYSEYLKNNKWIAIMENKDFIYAVICEEFGIIFAIGLMIIYFLLFYRGIRAAFVTKDSYSQLIAVGFSTMIACQTLVIIGGIFAVIPLTGITLPIISYGGSSVLTIFFALGILQKISEEA